MDRVQIKAVARSVYGKGPARQERRAGRIPAVVYRDGKAATHFSFDSKDFDKRLAEGRNALFQLELGILGQENTLALVKEVQRHPIRPGILHVDFLAVELKDEVTVSVPIKLEGNPEGVKLGGKLRRHLLETDLRCRADSIPTIIPIDISSMMPGTTLLLSRVTPPEGTSLVFRHDNPVVSVSSVVVEKAEGEAAAE